MCVWVVVCQYQNNNNNNNDFLCNSFIMCAEWACGYGCIYFVFLCRLLIVRNVVVALCVCV